MGAAESTINSADIDIIVGIAQQLRSMPKCERDARLLSLNREAQFENRASQICHRLLFADKFYELSLLEQDVLLKKRTSYDLRDDFPTMPPACKEFLATHVPELQEFGISV